MITFRHGGKTVTVEPGGLWTSQPGEDSYRDTPAGELWDIVREIRSGAPWRSVVARHYEKANPWLHQVVTSPARDLFFRQPRRSPEPFRRAQGPEPVAGSASGESVERGEGGPPSNTKVLDIGSGWGQIALPLARDKTNEVTALEPTPERLAFIQAAATQEQVADRMHFVQADFFDVEFEPQSFDLICSIGVLEWVAKFRPGEPGKVQAEFLGRVRALLKPGGQLVIGIENRLGLKYLLGAPDDHLGVPNIAIYDAALAAQKWKAQSGQSLRSFTFTRGELAELLTASGFRTTTFFAALPDYKLPRLILPLGPEINDHFEHGEFVPEHDGHSGQPLAFQAELQSHYRSLARLKIAQEFVPSFFVTASPE
jgi:2-polyprenyl-3-methyl-5-hydroxy-6-metoxy-1,4-benzoquinol methylase